MEYKTDIQSEKQWFTQLGIPQKTKLESIIYMKMIEKLNKYYKYI